MIDWTQFTAGNHRTTCPACGRGERDKPAGLTIEATGRGVFHCFRCGHVETFAPDRGKVYHLPMVRQPLPTAPAKHTGLSDWGRELWRTCHPLSGVAVSYLRARHCRIPPESGHLRYHPSLRHPSGHVGPALVALVTDAVTRQHLSLHRTWITPVGKAQVSPSRLLLGQHSIAGGCIRLWPDESVTQGLGIAEGIETALSLAWGYTPVWATVDAGHLAQFPVLAGIESLVIAQDQDPAGIAAATECASRWAGAGREVWVTRQSANDLNDALQEVAA